MHTVKLHLKTTDGGIIKKASILLDYSHSTGQHVMAKVIKRRKIDKVNIASRKCDPMEIEECSHRYRFGFIAYDDWDKLIEDEKLFTDCPKWFDTLEKLKKENPQFSNPNTNELF